jgi:hypothetical protein
LVTVTSSYDVQELELDIVHLKVVVPELVVGNVTAVVGDDAFAILIPFVAPITVHTPVSPDPTALPAKLMVPAQDTISAPALAVVAGSVVNVTS